MEIVSNNSNNNNLKKMNRRNRPVMIAKVRTFFKVSLINITYQRKFIRGTSNNTNIKTNNYEM